MTAERIINDLVDKLADAERRASLAEFALADAGASSAFKFAPIQEAGVNLWRAARDLVRAVKASPSAAIVSPESKALEDSVAKSEQYFDEIPF